MFCKGSAALCQLSVKTNYNQSIMKKIKMQSATLTQVFLKSKEISKFKVHTKQ
jgi:hypothetical protein